MEDNHPLAQLRAKVRKIDADILDLVAKRLELSREVGEHKMQLNIPIKDYRVEKQVIESARERARQLGVYPALAEDIAKTLIRYSVLRQDELKKSRSMVSHSLAKRRVLVIGGLGLMGAWMAGFFESLAYQVSIYDNRQGTSEFLIENDLASGCRSADLIVLATPLAVTEPMLRQVIDLKPRGIIIEICSLKSHIIPLIESGLQQGLSIASIHPMFGPNVETLADRNILLCEIGEDSALGVVEELLRTTSANLIRLPLQKHDALMSYVLGAAHIFNLIYAGVMERSATPLAEFERVGGTTFKNQIEVTRAVARENQDLYFEIQSLNNHTPQLLQTLLQVFEEYQDAIVSADRQAFKALMEKNRRYFVDEV